MKVKIGYRIDLDEVPKSVSHKLKLYADDLDKIKSLHELCVRLLNTSNDIVTVQAALKMINDIRESIISIDTALADTSALLIDYTNVLISPDKTEEINKETENADKG